MYVPVCVCVDILCCSLYTCYVAMNYGLSAVVIITPTSCLLYDNLLVMLGTNIRCCDRGDIVENFYDRLVDLSNSQHIAIYSTLDFGTSSVGPSKEWKCTLLLVGLELIL